MGYNNFVCVESVKVSYWRMDVSCIPRYFVSYGINSLFKFDPVTLEGGASWTGDMALVPGDL